MLEQPAPLNAAKSHAEAAIIGNKAFALLAGVGENAKRIGAQRAVTLLHAGATVAAFRGRPRPRRTGAADG